MTFYTGSQFPSRYQGGLFIAWHGSRFDPRLQPAGPGYIVTFTPFNGGKPGGKFETFAAGFDGGDPTPTGAAHRPVSVTQGNDGSLFISDDVEGWIWRVFYVGNGR
jgi:glucose/arabinose dehydrogenase